ncbi:hypothetical protein FHQ28_12565 [Pasteurellaceae bacterium USgator11]|nr:hypothetical protein FHQ20_11780 [Pasteurellaceae bacterium USgator41]TNG93781.1 hypothetical protein FHQ19_10750 [Pasteurellaceae bacterium UScroc12]TNG98048.1 hypothetical protein FHQ28_12565 [Pasteurellaceae bacterium USgator11]TNG99616.1 hypothetical protein FHQ24_05575 [Pasteurellaceae bacterium UScroc31]
MKTRYHYFKNTNWYLLKRPIKKETSDSWARNLEDLAKVALLAMPVVLYGQYSWGFKIFNSVILVLFSYFILLGAKELRKHQGKLSMEEA